MPRDVTPVMRPRTVAVLGASATRTTQGNQVIANLQGAGFAGRILPVHPTAEAINDLPAVKGIAALPPGVDTAVVAIPAAGVAAALCDLAAAGVKSAVVFSNGFSPDEERACRAVTAATPMVVHGPNCMGLIDLHERMPLYPATRSARLHAGPVALVAQSGSAAISIINSAACGFSTIVTMGSEFQVAAPDYLRFFATDPRTTVVAVVLESIQDPADFAAAAHALRDCGKSLAVLKVGRSDVGNRAVQAHTGAMISPIEAYDRFFARHRVPTARDYDELVATAEAMAATPRRPRGRRLGIVGISGGETALACDIAAELNLPLAAFAPATAAAIKAALPGAAGANPLDLGATVNHTEEQDRAAIGAILADPGVDALIYIQDGQATLTPTMHTNYTPHMREYAAHAGRTEKPVVLLSPSAESTHPAIHALMEPAGVPVLRGLRPGLVALRNMSIDAEPRPPRPSHTPHPDAAELRAAIAAHRGPLPADLTREILAAYAIPFAASALVPDAETALAAAENIGYPVVLKIASPDIPHRSDAGGVALGLRDAAALRTALAAMRTRLAASHPAARIEGYELQPDLSGRVEAMAGWVAAPPFGALLTLGSGGTLVELLSDRATDLCPVTETEATCLIAATALGSRLAGYRDLLPPTPRAALAALAANLSRLAADLAGPLAECDLNPILVEPRTGEARVVDALLVART
jgi:acetyltransferase